MQQLRETQLGILTQSYRDNPDKRVRTIVKRLRCSSSSVSCWITNIVRLRRHAGGLGARVDIDVILVVSGLGGAVCEDGCA